MKTIEQLEKEAQEARHDLRLEFNKILPTADLNTKIADAIILASVAMMTYQLAVARKEALDKIHNEMAD